MERKAEKEVLPTCKELNIGFVAYSPMASGFLSGKHDKNTVYEGDDVRRVISRFSPENREKNQALINALQEIAIKKGISVAQLCLAWLIYKNDSVIAIPGMRSDERIIENLGAANTYLSTEELKDIEMTLANFQIYGDRKDEDIAKLGTVTIS